jgi:cathepsin X
MYGVLLIELVLKVLGSRRLTLLACLRTYLSLTFSCMPYIACSSESTDGFCSHVDTTCTAANTCRTCDGSGTCREIDVFPNATIAEYGTYSYYTGGFGAVADKIKAEIYARGPVAAGVNAEPIVDYTGGVVYNSKWYNMMVNHVSSDRVDG